MSFSSSPMKKLFTYLSLDELEENTKKLEQGTKRQQEIEKMKAIIADLKKRVSSNQTVQSSPAVSVSEVKENASEIKEKMDLIGLANQEKIDEQKIANDLVDVNSHEKVSIQDTSAELEFAALKKEADVNSESSAEVKEAARYDRNLENSMILTGAYLKLKKNLGRLDFGYLRNHIDEAIGVTKDNPMDPQSEKEAMAEHDRYENQKKLVAETIRLNTTALSTKTISTALENEIKNFDPNSLNKVKTRDRQSVLSELKGKEHKAYSDEEVKKLDEKIVKQGKLVMTDIQGPIPQTEHHRSFNPLNWFRSTQNARKANLNQAQQSEEVNQNVVRKKM